MKINKAIENLKFHKETKNLDYLIQVYYVSKTLLLITLGDFSEIYVKDPTDYDLGLILEYISRYYPNFTNFKECQTNKEEIIKSTKKLIVNNAQRQNISVALEKIVSMRKSSHKKGIV